MNNLKDLFPEFYQSKLEKSDLIKEKENLIIIDTNYFLDILQMPISVSKKYIEALEKVKENIYIPYLVALEFNFKKSSKKKEKIKQIKKYKDNIANSISELEKNISTIDLVDTDEVDKFTKEMLSLTKDYSKSLKELLERNIESMITKEEDDIYEKLIRLIENRIGNEYEQEWIDEIETEGEERYKNNIPPGFADDNKGSEEEPVRRYGDIKYQRKFGDLLIWKDIIEYSKKCNKKGKKVIFVTNDGKSKKKNDLLFKIHDLTVGPHIHLMNELKTSAEKELYILDNFRFIQLITDLTDSEINYFKTSSEKKYKVKIPFEKIMDERKYLEKLSSENDKYEYSFDEEGYLTRKVKDSFLLKNELTPKFNEIFKEMNQQELDKLRESLTNYMSIDNLSFKKEKDMDNFRKTLLKYYNNQLLKDEDIDD
ncbi:PIN-like domain-containing protein [Enterococcus faecium]|uniref:PIN-like domain-containing protein n=1 Tax=Enterococcus faecium TaxID=1352 RepID=UPI003CE55A22